MTMNRSDAAAIVALYDCGNAIDDVITQCDDEPGWVFSMQLNGTGENDSDVAAHCIVDLATGRLIAEAAKKIIADRRAALGVEIEA